PNKDAYKRRSSIALKTARELSGYTQEDAAAELGIDNDTMSRWESGKRHIGAFELSIVAELYGATAAALLYPSNEISEIDDQLASVRQAAVAAGRVDAAGERIRPGAAARSPRPGRSPARKPRGSTQPPQDR
ncbi:MAG TPA: helix-turn-helix transcriptional regulator, partial [Candidatus Limnocylindrales bacterium]|nr:helix-turn-helix transcriptional regulator [Candidatus Limnocylindrales bacterium]